MSSDGEHGRKSRAAPARGTRRSSQPAHAHPQAELDAQLEALERESRDSLARASRPGAARPSIEQLEADLDALAAEAARASRSPDPAHRPPPANVPVARPPHGVDPPLARPSRPPAVAEDFGDLPAVLYLLGDDGEVRSAITPPPPRPSVPAPESDREPPLPRTAAAPVPMREPTPVPPEPSADAMSTDLSIPGPPPVPAAPRKPAASAAELELGPMEEPPAAPLEPEAAADAPTADSLPELALEPDVRRAR